MNLHKTVGFALHVSVFCMRVCFLFTCLDDQWISITLMKCLGSEQKVKIFLLWTILVRKQELYLLNNHHPHLLFCWLLSNLNSAFASTLYDSCHIKTIKLGMNSYWVAWLWNPGGNSTCCQYIMWVFLCTYCCIFKFIAQLSVISCCCRESCSSTLIRKFVSALWNCKVVPADFKMHTVPSFWLLLSH